MAGNQFGLRLLVFLTHLGRIATGALALDPFDALDEDRLGTQRLDLLLGCAAHIGGRNLRAEPPCGGNRLKACNAHTHHENARGLYRASRGHHHRERAAILLGSRNYRLVACKIRLAGKYVHALRACDARHEFHRKCFEARIGIGFDPLLLTERIEKRRNPSAGFRPAEQVQLGRLDTEHDIGVFHHFRRRAGFGSSIGIGRIRYRCSIPSAVLDGKFGPQADEFLHRFRSCGHPALASGPLFQDCDPQGSGSTLSDNRDDDQRDDR